MRNISRKYFWKLRVVHQKYLKLTLFESLKFMLVENKWSLYLCSETTKNNFISEIVKILAVVKITTSIVIICSNLRISIYKIIGKERENERRNRERTEREEKVDLDNIWKRWHCKEQKYIHQYISPLTNKDMIYYMLNVDKTIPMK